MIKGKRIAVFGLGIEGLSAIKYLSGANKVSVFDKRVASKIDSKFTKEAKKSKAKLLLGRSSSSKFDFVVRSPGVRPDDPEIFKLVSNGARLTSATNIFFKECPGQIIGVTGTKGKGTTSTLIYEILKTQDENVFLAGNIGTPMLDLLPKINKNSKVVLELSSFQLMDLVLSPHVAVTLMTTTEHLDWHKNQEEYLGAKSNIVKHQSTIDFAIFNDDFVNSKSQARLSKAKKYFFSVQHKTNGVYLDGDKIVSQIGKREVVCKARDINLPGSHNIQNIEASVAVAKIFKISNANILKVVKNFKGLKYRLELVAVKKGVKYYNDSFSTTPETTIAAIDAFISPKILILGGSSKKSDFKTLIQKIKSTKSIKALILIGQEGKRIKSMLSNLENNLQVVDGLKSMRQIIGTSQKLSSKGDVVLLSPACASFGMFKNYQDRGDQFTNEVKNL